MSSVINFYKKKGMREAFPLFLAFDIILEYFYHLVGI